MRLVNSVWGIVAKAVLAVLVILTLVVSGLIIRREYQIILELQRENRNWQLTAQSISDDYVKCRKEKFALSQELILYKGEVKAFERMYLCHGKKGGKK